MSISADFAQTFYIDKDTVKGAGYAFLNGIDLFFRSKPPVNGSTAAVTSASAGQLTPNPGVTIYICETETVNGTNVPSLVGHVKYGRKRLEYNSVLTSDAGLTATTFTFPVPVPVATNKSYAIVINFDGNDSQYSLWRNKAGESYNGVQNPTVTKGSLDGQFFVLTNGTVPTPLVDTDLKFILRGQKYSKTPTVFSAVNRSYEFLTLSKQGTAGALTGGEAVFANTGYISSQTVSVSTSSNTVTGTGTAFTTNFSIGRNIVINSGTSNQVKKITAIANSTSMTIDSPLPFTNATCNYLIAPTATVYDYNYLKSFCILHGSSANTTHNFIANATCNTIIGTKSGASVKIVETLDVPVNYFVPEFKLLTPVGTSANVGVKMSNTSYISDSSAVEIRMFDKNAFTKFKSVVASRSNEVKNPSSLYNAKSVNFDLTFQTTNEFVTPLLDEEDMLFHITSAYVNDDLSKENTSKGSALSKLISKKINLSDNQAAEDIKVYVTAHRPSGTDVEVFVKFYNNEDPQTFDDTGWTRLRNISPESLVSAIDNENDLVELEYNLTNYPISMTSTTSSGAPLSTSFSVNRNSNKFITDSSVDIASYLSSNSIVRIYNPLFPELSLVTAVTGIDKNIVKVSTLIDETDFSLAGFIGSGLTIEPVQCSTSAFKDITNSGILKYFNKESSAFKGYNSFAVKVILTGNSESAVVPLVDDIRAIAVSV